MQDIKEIIKYTLPLKLLLVEDDELARDASRFLLENLFENIIVAVDGQDGLDKFNDNTIDLIITDINMPHLNGLEMIKEIRKTDNDIPIIILSAHIEPQYFIDSISLNVKGYLIKPIEVSSLIETIKNVISNIILKDEQLKNMLLKEQMEHALLGNNDGLWDWNLTTNDMHYSSRCKEMIGYRDDEISNELSTWENRVHPDDLALYQSDMQDNINSKTDYFENVHRLKHKDGHWVWILDRGKTIFNEDGDAIRMIGTHTDITKSKEMEIKLSEQNKTIQKHHKYLQAIVDGTSDQIMVIREDYGIELMNSVLKDNLHNLNIADLQNPKCYEVSHNRSTPCDSNEHPCPLRDVLESKESTTVIHDHYDTDDTKHYIELVATPLFDENKECIGIIESARDITSHIKLQEELREQKNILHHQAYHDSLTGLANRVLFEDRLEQAILRSKRSNTKVALFFMDLDKFKRINDTLGHKAGDALLKSISKSMAQEMREEDTLARFGGDEFVIIMENLDEVEDALVLGRKILSVLEEPIEFEGEQLEISASIGISIYPDDDTQALTLLKYADIAMYRAKEKKNKNILFFS